MNIINKFVSGASYQVIVNRSPINDVFIDPLRWYLVVREIVYFEVKAENITVKNNNNLIRSHAVVYRVAASFHRSLSGLINTYYDRSKWFEFDPTRFKDQLI